MAATVRVDYYGASASEPAGVTAETGLTFNREDTRIGTTNPVPIPSVTGTAFSWIKQIALNVTSADATTLSNRRIKANSSPTTGLGLHFLGNATYVQPSSGNKPADSGSNGATPAGYTAMTTSYQAWDTGADSAGSTGRNGDFARLIGAVANNFAGGGGSSAMPNIGIAYDEA